MPIPDHIIDEIRDRADLVEIVGEVVTLKKRGKNFVGLCPFHTEKTPSFSVSPDRQMYYCFGCQAGGNVFSFLMDHEKLDFPEAVRSLGERLGVEVPDPEISAEGDPNAPLYHANRLAAEHYHHRLMESAEAGPAREYLEARGIDAAMWEVFLLGWAPDAWEELVSEAARQSVDHETLLAAGLCVRSEKTGGVYDRFRDRLCFPIRSVGGKVIAFSGRFLDDREPKYLNSSDTSIFTKGRTLFNLDLARGPIRRAGAAIVVEGNFDVVGLYAAGFRNVVAPLGTAMTEIQARILKRYTSTAYLAFDGDAAGERSAFRSADLLLAEGFAVRIVPVPAGSDPDSIVRKDGAPAFAALLESGRDVIDVKIDVVKERIDLDDVMKKRRAIQRLAKSIARVPDAVTRALYEERVANELQVPRETLAAERRTAPERRPERDPESRNKKVTTGPAAFDTLQAQEERYVLLHAINDRQWLDEALERCRPEFFRDPRHRALFEHLGTYGPEVEDVEERLRRVAEPELQGTVAGLEVWRARQGFPLSERSFRDSLMHLRLKAVERGVMPGTEPSGEPLIDALKQRDLARAIREQEKGS